MSNSALPFTISLAGWTGSLRRLAGWPLRVAAARRAMAELAGLDDRELADIGLARQDLRDVSALDLDEDPTRVLAARVDERRARGLMVRAPGPGGGATFPASARLTAAPPAPISSPASRPDGRRLDWRRKVRAPRRYGAG